MLGHAHARPGHHERRSGRDVEGAFGVAAGAAGVHQHSLRRAGRIEDGLRVVAHGGGKADQFLHGLALCAECSEQGDDLRVAHTAGEQLLHGRIGFRAAEVFSGFDFFGRFSDHGVCLATCLVECGIAPAFPLRIARHRSRSCRNLYLRSGQEPPGFWPQSTLLEPSVQSKLPRFNRTQILALMVAR